LLSRTRRPPFSTEKPISELEAYNPAVGFYRRFILPHLINAAMSNKDTARCRAEVIPQAHGRVVEIGIGSGLNLTFYSNQVTELYGVDPSKELLEMARKKAGSVPFRVELVNSTAEELPFESHWADTIVMTWTLCSIGDPEKALSEVRRVLKPGGRLIFVEHGLAPEAKVRSWQSRINTLWKAIAGGCNLNRDIDRLIASSGFEIQRLETSYMPGPKMFTFTYKGSAAKY
jgi:ubiquinone/menaquinone biosynthesis C-methylase UbiE